ncbi:hypothetical protein [Nocardia gipuzkoensis]|uniref:hypothetical protein n=1 Tax=Nocardia gipuzkoensis TaxID=2749991 RepID=UPI00237EB563|nr:hypothetical protein [Nocardia gipuzkoensis]MDE1674294.1 hypothetical protein [Nocardia gipuzkoensis]
MIAEALIPPEGDVHLRIWLADTVFDYTAAAAAVRNLPSTTGDESVGAQSN